MMQVEFVTASSLFRGQSFDQFTLQVFECPLLKVELILGLSQSLLGLLLEGLLD